MFIKRMAFFRWVSSEQASKELGFSEKSLDCWRNCGYLKLGKHWKESPDPINKGILYNLVLCEVEMQEWWGRDAVVGP